MAGLANGGAATGTPGTPAHYASGTSFLPGQLMVTSFNSWEGVANPGAPFHQELGNRLHFGLNALGNGSLFSLSQLCFDMSSSDPANSLAFSGCFGAGDVYSSARVGIHYGSDGVLGGGDDTIITSGAATQLVHQLIYVGVGNAFWPGGPGDPLNGQAAINAAAAYIAANHPFSVTTRYWLVDPTGATIASGEATADVVPEPATLMLLGSGLAALALRRRRRT
jgi:hypothetical protein